METLLGYFEYLHFLVRCLRYRFRTEKLQVRTLMMLDLSGATVIDIGANKGIYCFWMTHAVGAQGHVLAFEPQPEMRDYIERRKAQLRWQNLTLFNVALSSTEGSAQLARQKVGDGSASLEESRRCGQTIVVPITTLDRIENVDNLKFIKCDVEGHEYDVFCGAEQTIRRFRPIVQFEARSDKTASLFSFFRGIGYSGVMFLGDKYLHYSNPNRIPHYKFGQSGHRDFLFFPREALGSIIPDELSRSFPPECLTFPEAKPGEP
jgi:FkbM family methyltransferase